ncbi:TonB-dependent siderophore receptor [Pseudomonas sp. NPDC007930]|uniref:TonB-dependent siderophore receptor n=1 Tax=Pseudomonas sp. NPDC007930 TaxID=3364417 RepID=UPI0036EACB94
MPRRTLALTLLAAPLGLACCLAQAASFDLPAASLATTLGRIAQQSGREIAYPPALVSGLQAPPVRGEMSAEQALAQALAGSGLGLERTPGGSLTLKRLPAGEVSLGEVNINAHADSGADNGDFSYVARNSRGASKTDTPLVEVPQSVSVVTRKQMNDQAVQDVSQAVRYTPGIYGEYTGSNNSREQFRMRGFSPYVFQDGLMLPYGESGQGSMSEPYGLQSVEVVRGPSSMLYGQSRPGGLINLTSKMPTTSALHQLQLQAGSHDLKQAALDLGGALDEQGQWSYRLTGLSKDSGTQVKHVANNRDFFAPAITWRPNERTSLTLLAQYQHDWGGTTEQYYPERGSLDGSPWGHIGSSTLLGDPHYDQMRRESYQLGYLFEHQLNSTWTLRQNLRWTKVNVQNRSAFNNGYASTTSPVLNRLASDIKRNIQIFNVDNQAQARFATGALQHTALMGLDLRRNALDNDVVNGTFTSLDPFNPSYAGSVSGQYVGRDMYQVQKQTGLYLQDQIKWDHWIVTLGGRYDRAESTSHFRPDRANPADRSIDQDDHKATWRAGLGYLFDNGLMPYVSYSQAFDPTLNTSVSATTPIFKPTEGEQYEAGVKYQPPGQDSYLAASVYKLTQKNLTTADPADTRNTVQIGEAVSRGLELEGKAALTRNLDLLAAYTYTDSEITRSGYLTSAYTDKGNELPFTPRHQASLWFDYTLREGPLAGLGLGAGARYTGALWGSSGSSPVAARQRIKTGNVTVADAAVHYDLGELAKELEGTRVALNASNLFDKQYVTACSNPSACYYGPRRNVIATLSYNW